MSPGLIKASSIRWARTAINCMNGRSRRRPSARSMGWREVRAVLTTRLPRNTSRMSERRSWAATCSAAAAVRGGTIPGAVGWAENPPFHTPVFVLKHHAREPLEMQGGTTFYFVTEGIHAALQRAKEAARGKDVTLGGGADVAQQYLKAGLVDEMDIHVVPVLLGDGARLFDKTGGLQTGFECVRVVNSPSVSHYKYVRRAAESEISHQGERMN
jgi:dihydrofolate reductase